MTLAVSSNPQTLPRASCCSRLSAGLISLVSRVVCCFSKKADLSKILEGDITPQRRMQAASLIAKGASIDSVLDILVQEYNRDPASALVHASFKAHYDILVHALANRDTDTALKMLKDIQIRFLPEQLTDILTYILNNKNLTNREMLIDALIARNVQIPDDLRQSFRSQGLYPAIFLKYAQKVEEGDVFYTHAIRTAHPEFETDLWANSDFHLDEQGNFSTSDKTAREFYLDAIQNDKDQVLRALRRTTHVFHDIPALEIALSLGKMGAAAELIKAKNQITGMPPIQPFSGEGENAQTPTARLFDAIQYEDIVYFSTHKDRVESFTSTVEKLELRDLEAAKADGNPLKLAREKREVSPVECALIAKKYVSCVCLIDRGYPVPKKLSKSAADQIVHYACLMGKENVIRKVKKKCKTADIQQKDKTIAENLRAIIRKAIDEDDREMLQKIAVSELYYPHKDASDSPVIYALMQGNYFAVSLFLNFGCYDFPIEAFRPEVFLAAAEHGHKNTLKLLLNSRVPLPSTLIPTALEKGWDVALAIILTHPMSELPHPFHWVVNTLKTNYRTSLGEAFRKYLNPLDKDESGKSVLQLLLEVGDLNMAVILLKDLIGAFPEQKKEIAKFMEEIANSRSFPNLTQTEKCVVLYACLGVFGGYSGLPELSLYLKDFQVVQMLPQIIPEYGDQMAADIVTAFDTKLQAELARFEGHAKTLALDPLSETVANMAQIILGLKGMEKLLNPAQRKLLVQWANKISECLNRARAIEGLLGQMQELGITTAKTPENFQKIGKWIATFRRDDLPLLNAALNVFGGPKGIPELSLYLDDCQVFQRLPEIIPGYNAQTTDEIAGSFIARLRAELDAFEGHAVGLALEPLSQTVTNMVRLELGFKAMEKLLNKSQKKQLLQWAHKIGDCLKEAASIEAFLGKMQELGVTEDRTQENFQRIGKWMATLKKEDLPLLKSALKYFGEPVRALGALCEYVDDRELLREIFKEFSRQQFNEFGRELAYRLGCKVLEFTQAKNKTSQVHLAPMLTDMTKLYSFAQKVARFLDGKVVEEIQAQALKAKDCLPAFEVADDFTALLKSAGITRQDSAVNRRKMGILILGLVRKEVLPDLNGERGHYIEQALSYFDGDLYKGILSYYPHFPNVTFLATLPGMKGSLLQGIDSFIAARLQALKKKENTDELLKLLLLWQALKPLRTKAYNIPLDRDLAGKVFKEIEHNIRVGAGALHLTSSQYKNLQEQLQFARRLRGLLSKRDQETLHNLQMMIDTLSVKDIFSKLIDDAEISDRGTAEDIRKMVHLIDRLRRDVDLPGLNTKQRWLLIECALSFFKGDLVKGIIYLYPHFRNPSFIAKLPHMNEFIVKKLDLFTEEQLGLIGQNPYCDLLIKLYLFSQALHGVEPVGFPLNRGQANQIFTMITTQILNSKMKEFYENYPAFKSTIGSEDHLTYAYNLFDIAEEMNLLCRLCNSIDEDIPGLISADRHQLLGSWISQLQPMLDEIEFHAPA